MDFNEDAKLDTSQVEDLRGGGGVGGRVAVGGGGVGLVGLLIYFLISQLGGPGLVEGPGSVGVGLPQAGQTSADGQELAQKCQTGHDVANNADCEAVAVINSIQSFWTDRLRGYRPAPTVFFSGSVNTGCGGATSDTGPFYCPADGKVYIDLTFYGELESRFGARGGPFARAYVLAHEYGHHVQHLIGTTEAAQAAGAAGPTSGSVRLELQADCYAGVWANHATQVPTASGEPLINNITRDDIAAGVDTAERIGDDYIQTHLGGGRVNESQFTHGSSAQREKWLNTGLQSGDTKQCDTFRRGVNLG